VPRQILTCLIVKKLGVLRFPAQQVENHHVGCPRPVNGLPPVSAIGQAREFLESSFGLFVSSASVARLPLHGRVPAIIVNHRVDAAVNNELRCLVVSVDGVLMQDARRLVLQSALMLAP
jgi:hypothetical protein